ncbi:2-desacetyl-2-hydroxyethyl bacteriochlorophyllide A dehydrogenase [Cohaesibacter marisflavi]|uniref:2-desacetyl-2-hydroxyethyl bacteriochlorophyllide A dehydrogenase n=1 Tax=Cohaesibacter marisflavi TaxID=655353 RepID=A0A1I5IVQ3_9HYPH|nr:zinc-binding alcohol dehydrogenase family protein [Cohaesibacter marisflavi]SFO64562.1 2-desacetyl-2-hydroxyethyl bacteriochlorophyllide A dehydrogenase [Cohaesibacter marisflavi]
MKALCIVDAEKSEVRDVEPMTMGPDDVVVDISYVGFCGSDLNTYMGKNPLVQLPRIPGHEASGFVVEKGANVGDEIKIGQSVILWPYSACGHCSSCRAGRPNACRYNETLGVQRDGALREKMVIRADCVVPNESLSPKRQVLVEPLSVGFHAVSRGRVEATDTVVVMGCGMIGVGAIMGAAARGARVIAVDLSPEKEEIAKLVGATEFLTLSGEELVKKVNELTDDHGANVVIEAVGLPITFTTAIDAACFAGRVVYVGYSKAPVTYETKFFNLKELDIMGSRNAMRPDFDAVIEALLKIGDKMDTLITKTFPMDEAADVLPYWEANKNDVLKLVVEL